MLLTIQAKGAQKVYFGVNMDVKGFILKSD